MAEKKLDPVAVLGKDRDGFLRRGRTKKAVKHVRIEGWSTTTAIGRIFVLPHLGDRVRISGRVYGHPTYAEGQGVTTSEVTKVEGRLITVASGKRYRLGRPDGKWLAWLRKERAYDRKNPISGGADGR